MAATMLAAGCGETGNPAGTGAQPNRPIDSRGTPSQSTHKNPATAPVSGLEGKLRQIAATSATPHYYLGAEFAGEKLTDVSIFDDDSGAEAERDISLDSGQTLARRCEGVATSDRVWDRRCRRPRSDR